MGHNLDPIRALDEAGIRQRRLDAIAELIGEVQHHLTDAEDLAMAAARAGRSEAQRLSEQDAAAFRSQIEVLVWCRTMLERAAAAERGEAA